MADFEQREGGMSIFQNGYKNSPNQPDWKGTALIDGKKKQISCWTKTTRNGDEFLSCQVQDEYVKPQSTTAKPEATPDGRELNPNYDPNAKSPINNDFDDDIPF